MIEPKICGWTDDGSGLKSIRYEIYQMRDNAAGVLEELGNPVITYDDPDFRDDFRYRIPAPGVWSIQLFVSDLAGNCAGSRKLFVFTGDTRMTGQHTNGRMM